MPKEINPEASTRAKAYMLWMKAPNPMVTFFKTIDVTNAVKVSRKRKLKFNMLMDYCIGKAAVDIKEFYILPVGEKLIQYDKLAVNTIIKTYNGNICSCDIPFSDDIELFNTDYINYTTKAAENCTDNDLSSNCMVIGTSAVIETELDGVVSMNSGFNNPFIIWGKYRKKFLGYYLPVSFQFHHTQMDGSHAAGFLENLQKQIKSL